MASDEEMKDPWPVLVDKLVCTLNREELDSIVDCLRSELPLEWRKKELGDPNTPKMDVIRKFIDILSENRGESGFLKLMLDVTKNKKLAIRTEDGENIRLHKYLKECEKKLISYENYCLEKNILKSCDFVGRKEEMKTLKKLLFREKDQIAGTWISGIGGTGKTTLANQVCGTQGQYRKLYVDLKTTSTTDDFYDRLIGPLGIPPLQQDQKICWETIYEELRKAREPVVLYLDSFETLLSPNNPNTSVWEILKEILSIKNSKVKLLITSVHSPDDCMPGQDRHENLEHFKLRLFTQEECNQLIRKVAPKIIRDPKQRDNINMVVSKLCGFNTLAVQAVFSYLQNYSDCITLEEFLANDKQQLKSAENYDQQTSEVTNTLERVFDGLRRDTQVALIKLSLCDGVQLDFNLAQSLLGKDQKPTLYSLVRAHLLQVEVKDKASTVGQKIDDADTRYFLHSLLQNLLEKKREMGDFSKDVESAKANLRKYIEKRLLELGEMESQGPNVKAGVTGSELQPLVGRYCSMPSIDNEHAESYNKATRFQASLQYFLKQKNLVEFYAEQLEFACGPRQKLKWVFLKLSQIDVLLNTGSSLEAARVMLDEVEKELESFRVQPAPRALRLSRAHFDLVQGRYHGLCWKFDQGISLIKQALGVYENEDGFSRQAARALHAIATIHAMKSVDSYSVSESKKYSQRAFEKLGQAMVHFDLIVYAMNIGLRAHILGGLKQSTLENAKKGKTTLSQEKVNEYRKDIKKCFEEAFSYYEKSIGLCETLKMKRSLEYIQLLRQKALLLAEFNDIKEIEEAVRLAEESYRLLQEYDETDKAHMAKCCFAIAHVHKKLGEKMYDAYKAREDYAGEARYAPLWEAYYKFKRGFQFMKDGNVLADTQDYYGWPNSLQDTMRWLGFSDKERKNTELEIELYVKNNIHERKSNAPLQSALPSTNTRKKSVQGSQKEDALRQKRGKRHSIDQSQEDMMPRKRRGSILDDGESMDHSPPVVGPNPSYFSQKRHSVSDELPMVGLRLDAEPMETCSEEKQKQPNGVLTKCKRVANKLFRWNSEQKEPDTLQVEKDPEDVSDDKSGISDLSEKDSALTDYSRAPSISSKSGSSADLDLYDKVGVQQSPSRSSPRKYKYPQASVSHGVAPIGVPEIKVTNEGEQDEDSRGLIEGLPFLCYGNTDSPHSKVKHWLDVKDQLKRPSSPGGSSDESFHSAMDVQD